MDTWWIDTPHLLGSRNPTVADLEQLRREGFGVLVSLLEEEEQSPRYDVGHGHGFGVCEAQRPRKRLRPPDSRSPASRLVMVHTAARKQAVDPGVREATALWRSIVRELGG